MVVPDAITGSLDILFSLDTLLFLLVGLSVGIIFGALPGIGATLGMVILLPLTLPFEGVKAIILLVAIYLGGTYGGSISAILINVPGTGAAAATTFDGYPMARAGKAMNALAISAVSSGFGGLIAAVLVVALTPFLVEIVLLFGTPEYFLLAILGLTMITVIAKGSMVKGLVAGSLGLFSTAIGIAPMSYQARYTFGLIQLRAGFGFIASLLALFAVSEMILLARGTEQTIADMDVTGSRLEGAREVFRHPVLVVKSAVIGLFIGMVPGSGASISNFLSYAEALRSSDNSEAFGTGTPEGVIASEVSNNSTVPGSVVPTIAFGIPGSGASAVLLGALILHGLTPGPQMFSAQLDITYAIFLSLLLGSIFIFVIGLAVVTRASIFTRVDLDLIIPMIVVLSVLGGFTLESTFTNVYYLIVLGIIGYFMKKYDYSIVAFVLGAILGPIAEENLWRSLQISEESWGIFIANPISAVLVVAIFAVLFGPMIRKARAA